jgi:ferredoxin-thioredoxin reductase catalytic subunit
MKKEEYIEWAKAHNMELNMDTVDRILKRLDITGGYCPCVPPDQWTEKHICPCAFCEEDVAKNGRCHCNLFIKKQD